MANLAIRSFGATLCGIVAAGVLIATIEWVGHQMAGWGSFAPFIAALLGYGVGGFIGALLARHLAPRPAIAGWAVVAVLWLLAAINLFAFRHPDWFAPIGTAILGLAGWTAARIKP